MANLSISGILRGAKNFGRRNASAIFMGGGIFTLLGAVGTGIYAGHSAKCEEILEDHRLMMQSVEDCKKLCEEKEEYQYTKWDEVKDKVIFYIRTGSRFVIHFLPTILLTAASITLFGCSRGIIKAEKAAAMTTLSALSESFSAYRQRVIEDQGEAKDEEYYYGIKEKAVEIVEDKGDGKAPKKKKEKAFVQEGALPPFSFWFDETFKEFSKDTQYNISYLLGIEGNLESKLQENGTLYYNEIRDAFRLPRVAEGCHFGIRSNHGENHVDLGIKKELWRLGTADRCLSPAFLITPNIDTEHYIWENMPKGETIDNGLVVGAN